MLYNVT